MVDVVVEIASRYVFQSNTQRFTAYTKIIIYFLPGTSLLSSCVVILVVLGHFFSEFCRILVVLGNSRAFKLNTWLDEVFVALSGGNEKVRVLPLNPKPYTINPIPYTPTCGRPPSLSTPDPSRSNRKSQYPGSSPDLGRFHHFWRRFPYKSEKSTLAIASRRVLGGVAAEAV